MALNQWSVNFSSCILLGDFDTLGRFSAIYYKGDNFRGFLFAFSAHQALSEKRVYTKKKEFASLGSKFFPFIVDPFSEGR